MKTSRMSTLSLERYITRYVCVSFTAADIVSSILVKLKTNLSKEDYRDLLECIVDDVFGKDFELDKGLEPFRQKIVSSAKFRTVVRGA